MSEGKGIRKEEVGVRKINKKANQNIRNSNMSCIRLDSCFHVCRVLGASSEESYFKARLGFD